MSKIKVFEQAIKDFGVEAALEYFDVPEKDKNNFRQIFGLDPAPVLLPLVEKKEIDWAKVIEKSVNIMQDYATLVAQDLVLKTTVRTTADILSAIPLPPPEGNTPASEQGEGYEVNINFSGGNEWVLVSKSVYDNYCADHRRKVIYPLIVEKKTISGLRASVEYIGAQSYFNKWIRELTREEQTHLADMLDEFHTEQSPPSLQEREKGMKWVKASERLPEGRKGFAKQIVTKWTFDKIDGEDNTQMRVLTVFELLDLSKHMIDLRKVEWLDESQDTAKQSK